MAAVECLRNRLKYVIHTAFRQTINGSLLQFENRLERTNRTHCQAIVVVRDDKRHLRVVVGYVSNLIFVPSARKHRYQTRARTGVARRNDRRDNYFASPNPRTPITALLTTSNSNEN